MKNLKNIFFVKCFHVKYFHVNIFLSYYIYYIYYINVRKMRVRGRKYTGYFRFGVLS